MLDFANKIVSIVLCFVMLVFAPLMITYSTNDMIAKKEIMNDVAQFIDMAKDSGSITQKDLDKLYLDCNSHGMAVKVDVKRLIRVAVTDDEDVAKTVYYSVEKVEDLQNMNPSDVVQVNVKEIGITSVRNIIYKILGMDIGKFDLQLAGTVG